MRFGGPMLQSILAPTQKWATERWGSPDTKIPDASPCLHRPLQSAPPAPPPAPAVAWPCSPAEQEQVAWRHSGEAVSHARPRGHGKTHTESRCTGWLPCALFLYPQSMGQEVSATWVRRGPKAPLTPRSCGQSLLALPLLLGLSPQPHPLSLGLRSCASDLGGAAGLSRRSSWSSSCHR